MSESPFEMSFDIQTIKHLGVRMYSTLPPALAEIISNSYDADADKVKVTLTEVEGIPCEIKVEDNGIGLTSEEINSKFLIIGRDRRKAEGDNPSVIHKRLPTGKKGLGKLALFGLANTITIATTKDKLHNEFELDWDDLISSAGTYKPKATKVDEVTNDSDGTSIVLSKLKRESSFDVEGLVNSLSRIFILDEDFELVIESPSGEEIPVTIERRYEQLDQEFEWDVENSNLVGEGAEFHGKLKGFFKTSKKPLSPSSGLRGITLFSRGKLVNAPEYFSNSTSSHFFQYLTGAISVDFIDELEEDVISTNRQSLDWENPDLSRLQDLLSQLVGEVNSDWRKKRKEKKNADLEKETGIDVKAWVDTLPEDVKKNTEEIIETLGGEDALESFPKVIRALHNIAPEYPRLHWRHLHPDVRDRIKEYYVNQQFGDAASQGTQIYTEKLRNMSGRTDDGRSLVNNIFGSQPFDNPLPEIQLNELSTDSEKNIQEGQGHLSRGVITGFRNPISHGPIDSNVPDVFSELDCLNILSLISYLLERLEGATVNTGTTNGGN
jgi:uncharacterized protein (TIGR02391 family)